MHKEIRPTDIQWLATGYWRHYFKHKTLRGVANHSIASIISIIMGAIFLFTGLFSVNIMGAIFLFTGLFSVNPEAEAEAPLPPYVTPFIVTGAVLVVTAIILFIVSAVIERAEEDKFIDYIADRYEKGDTSLPDAEDVSKYLNINNLLT